MHVLLFSLLASIAWAGPEIQNNNGVNGSPITPFTECVGTSVCTIDAGSVLTSSGAIVIYSTAAASNPSLLIKMNGGSTNALNNPTGDAFVTSNGANNPTTSWENVSKGASGILDISNNSSSGADLTKVRMDNGNDQMIFYSGNAEYMRIKSPGVHIGNTAAAAPATVLEVTANNSGVAGTTGVVQVSSANAASMWKVDNSGHVIADATNAPGVSANCAANTGSSDVAGSVTISGGVTAACTVTFSVPYANAPFCVANDATANSAVKVAPTTTTVVLTLPGNANDTIHYHCIGR